MAGPVVTAVSVSVNHTFSKVNQSSIQLLTGLGVAGDAHAGKTVQHLSRKVVKPQLRNLRQVHLIDAELHDELKAAGFDVAAGAMGENITTRGLDLLSLPLGTKLHIGSDAVIELTGLRNPCKQLNGFQDGLMKAVLARDEHGKLIRKAGVMAVVCQGAEVRPGDHIRVELPPQPHEPLPVV